MSFEASFAILFLGISIGMYVMVKTIIDGNNKPKDDNKKDRLPDRQSEESVQESE